MKKVLALVLAVVLVAGMSVTAFAAEKIDVKNGGEIVYSIGKSATETVTANGSHEWNNKGDDVEPGSELEIYLDPSDFINVPADGKLTTSRLSNGNISVKKKVSKGSDLIDTIELKNDNSAGTVYIKIEMKEPFVSTASKDFDFTIYLAKKSSKIANTELQITGTMSNEEIEVDEGDDEVDLSGDAYAKAIAYVKSIRIDAGNGLYVNTKMFDGQKYYAKSVQEITAEDDAVISQYPEIDTVYTLYSINLSGAGNTVSFDISDTYYVYNADGQYIGTTSDKLPMSSKYYLATSRIDMGGSTDETVEGDDGDDNVPVDGDTQNAGTGGDDVPANANDNPGTGANGFVNVAVVAGLVALAAAGAVTMKK